MKKQIKYKDFLNSIYNLTLKLAANVDYNSYLNVILYNIRDTINNESIYQDKTQVINDLLCYLESFNIKFDNKNYEIIF